MIDKSNTTFTVRLLLGTDAAARKCCAKAGFKQHGSMAAVILHFRRFCGRACPKVLEVSPD